MAQVEQIIKIRVIGKDAETRLDSLQLQINANKEAQKNLNNAYKKGEVSAKDYARSSRLLKEESKALGSEQRQLTKETQATAGSYNDLSAKMSRLKKKQKDVNVATKEGQASFDKYAKEINDTNKQLKQLDAKNGVYTRNVGNYSDAVSGLARNFNVAGVNVGMLASQMGQGATAISAVASATGGASRMLKLFKIALISTGVGILIVALGSLVSYFSKTREGGETIRIVFAQIGQVVNVLVERLTLVGSGIAKILSGDFKGGIEEITGALKGMGDELEREIRLVEELERKAIALEKAEILLNAQRANTNREIKKLQLLAETEDGSVSLENRRRALESAIQLQKELSNLETRIQKQKIKNILGETKGQAKLNFVIQQLRDGFTSVTEASNKANAIIDEIGLDPSAVDDLKTLVDEVIKLEDLKASSLKKQRTLQTKLNSLNREAAKEQKNVNAVTKEGQTAIINGNKKQLEQADEKLDADLQEATKEEVQRRLEADMEIVQNSKNSAEQRRAVLQTLLDDNLISEKEYRGQLAIIEEGELLKQEQILLKREALEVDHQQKKIQRLRQTAEIANSLIDSVSTMQQAAMNRELAAAGNNAEKREQIERKFAKKQKKIAISQAFIRGALAIQKIAADVPKGDFGITTGILMGLQAASTAAQISLIKSQKLAKGGRLEEFANGGIAQTGGVLQGASHAMGGIPFKVGGRAGFEAEGGEAIINKRSSSMFTPLLSAINQAGGGKAFATGGQLPSSTTQNITNMFSVQELAKQINTIKVVQELPTAMSGQNELNALTVNNKFA